MGTPTIRTARDGSDGTALTPANVPANSVTVGTASAATFASLLGKLWYRFVAGSGAASKYRLNVTSSTVQSFRGVLTVPSPSTNSIARQILIARGSGQALRVRVTADRQLVLSDASNADTGVATTITGGLAAGSEYEVVLDFTVGTTTSNGTATLRVCPVGTDTALTGGTVTSSTMNLGTTPVTAYDVGNNDTATGAMDFLWRDLQWENDRTSSLPVYSTGTVVAGNLTGSGAFTASAGVAVPAGNYDVVVGFIQSNMRGRADDFDYPTTDFYRPGVYQWDPVTNSIAPAKEPAPVFEQTPYMGPMNRFSRAYVDGGSLASGRALLLVNLAEGGTGLTLPDSNGGKETWWPQETDPAKVDLYARATSELDAVFAAVGTGSRVVAVLANHGSTDGSNNTPKETFKSRLLDLITATQGFLFGAGYAPTARTRYVMMQMRPSLRSETRHAIIDDAQQEVAASTLGVRYSYSPAGAEFERPDSVHFNAAGVREIGTRMYAVWASGEVLADMSGSGQFTAAATAAYARAASLTGSGSATAATAPATVSPLTGNGSPSAGTAAATRGDLAAAGALTAAVAARYAVDATLALSGAAAAPTAAAVPGSSTATGTLTAGTVAATRADIAGAGACTAGVLGRQIVDAVASGDGTFTAVAESTGGISAVSPTLVGSGGFTAAAVARFAVTGTLVGSGTVAT